MAGYQGDIHLADTIDIKFVTTSASTGAPTTLSGSPVISAYVGNSTTQITAGITLSVDFDGVTGLNNVRVVASGANGYAAATNISLIITTGTVGGTSAVGYEVGSFSIDNRPVNATLIAGQTITAAAGVTFPSSVASPTNITAGTITTATNVTTVNGLAAGVITAASIASAAFSAAKFAADSGIVPIRSNTAQAGAGTSITLDASASASNSFYNNCLVLITGGTGIGQARFITAYVGSTKVATVATWVTNPDNTSTFAILPFDAVAGATAPTAAQVATAVWQDTTGSDFTTAGSPGFILLNQMGLVDSGTAQSATGTTLVMKSAAAFADNELVGAFVEVYSATTGVGQTRQITANVGSTDTLTVDAWATTPTGTIRYNIFAGAPASTASPAPANVTQILGTAVSTPATAGILDVNLKNIANAAVSTSSAQLGVNAVQLGGQTASAAGTVTLPGTIASPTNITAGVITTVTNLTNAPTAGDLTATMKTSVGTAVAASAVASVTGNVGGNVTGTVGSVVGAVGSVTGNVGGSVATLAGSAGIKKNTAKAAFPFAMTDSTNHAPVTGLAVTATRSIDGGAFAACANAVTEVSAGWYKISLAATDLNGDTIALKFTAAGADQLNISLVTGP